MDGVKDTVHKRPGLFGGKFFCQFDRFIQDNLGRGVRAVHFMNRQTQDRTIDGREPFEAPVVCLLYDDRVERGDVLRRAFK